MKTHLSKFIIFFAFVVFNTLFSQSQKIIDSLKHELKKNPDKLQKTKIYGNLSWYYNSISLDSALHYGLLSQKFSKEINDENLYAQSLSDLGAVYYLKGEIGKSTKYYLQSLEIRKKQKNEDRIAALQFKLGNNYYRSTDYKSSMNSYLNALKHYEKTSDKTTVANLKSNIGTLYYALKNYKKATDFFSESIDYFEAKKIYALLCNSLVGLGSVYHDQKKYDLALQNFEKAKHYAEISGNKVALGVALNNIGNIYLDKKLYQLSTEYLLKSLKIRNDEKYFAEAASSKISLAKSYNYLKNYKIAKQYLFESLSYNKKNGTNEKNNQIYQQLVIANAGIGNIDSVNFYLKNYIAAVDHQTNKNVLQITSDLETKYQTNKKEKQIEKQKVEIVEKEKNIKQILIIGGSILGILLLLSYLIYNNQKLKNKQQKQEFELQTAIEKIETQNKLHDQRLAISRDLHDNIGAQLTFIISSIETLKSAFKIDDEKINKKLNSISSFTRETITELRDTIWAMNNSEISFDEMNARIMNFVEKANKSQENVNINFTIDRQLENLKFTSTEGMNIYRIIQEAVNNALKYSDAKNIEISAAKMEDEIQISIADDGKGFNKNEIILGSGLQNMQKRASEIGKNFHIFSEKEKGTLIDFTLSKKI